MLVVDTVTTLIVKHAPSAISGTAEKAIAYFQQYQASAVRPMQGAAMISTDTKKKARITAYSWSYANKRGTVFLDFVDPAAAARAYNQLQQLDRSNSNSDEANTKEEATAIAPHLGVHYPANPQLRYRYPEPTPEILENMMHAIATVPRLYVQTLHLMNKMNLAPPFAPLSPESIPHLATARSKRKQDDLVDTDESELESDPEEKQKAQEKQAAKSRVMAAANERRPIFEPEVFRII
ncbi:hypothetical protein BX666DRAFT_1882536 [Dichotomocladium elegans]|nr:hypothetical protein BX666DRAFT_1882536 [Dichotomocladium elegans]